MHINDKKYLSLHFENNVFTYFNVKIKEVIDALERFAPLPLQEDWDNAGLQIGLTETEASGALLCLDVNEHVVDEAVRKGFNVVVAHHPLLFRGLKQISDADDVQRTVTKAVKNDIAIVAMHTKRWCELQNSRKAPTRKCRLLRTKESGRHRGWKRSDWLLAFTHAG